MSVSYTHLTIHMDTTVTSAQSEALFGENGPYPTGVFPVLVEADAIQAAVSYTHLDVYKRQRTASRSSP